MPNRIALLAGLILLLVAPTASAQTLFSEDWDDSLGANRWSAPITAIEEPGIGFDGGVDYAFDYSTLGVGPAPNGTGGTTTGVFMETNLSDQCPGIGCVDDDEGEGVGIIPLGFTLPATNYRFTADLYLFWNGGSGSTEYATFGVHHQGSGDVPLRFNLNNGDGLAWQIDTDGESSNDLLRYESPGSGETGLGGWEAIPDGTIPGVSTGGASQIGVFNRWVELSITSQDGLVEFAINDAVIDSFDNANESFDGGTILLGQSDVLNSVNSDNASGLSSGAVFDNVLVTALTPTLVGDYNRNGAVDAADYTIWRDTLGEDTIDPKGSGADGNKNGFIDLLDRELWIQKFGQTTPPAIAVPEPASLLTMLLVAGLMPKTRR